MRCSRASSLHALQRDSHSAGGRMYVVPPLLCACGAPERFAAGRPPAYSPRRSRRTHTRPAGWGTNTGRHTGSAAAGGAARPAGRQGSYLTARHAAAPPAVLAAAAAAAAWRCWQAWRRAQGLSFLTRPLAQATEAAIRNSAMARIVRTSCEGRPASQVAAQTCYCVQR